MIKPIDEIPMSQKRRAKSYKEKIRDDIQEAIDKGIYKFEFVGDYNFNTLAGSAQEEARNMAYNLIIKWSKQHPEYKERYTYWIGSRWETKDLNLITVSSIKGERPNTRRVFCEIEPDIDAVIKEYAEKRCEAYEKRKREKE